MHHSISLSAAILVAILTSFCRAADNEDFADYKISALGERGELYCNSSDSEQARAIPSSYEPVAWILPNLSRVYETIDRFEVGEDNWTLAVNDTTINDLGVYHCMLQNPNDSNVYYLVKVGLNSEGPYFFDAWEKYMWPTIIAICAFFGFLILTAISILLYIYRYIPPKKEDEDSLSKSSCSEEEKKEALIVHTETTVVGHKEEVKNGEIHGAISAKPLHSEFENPAFNSHEDVIPPQHHDSHTTKELDHESSDEDTTVF